MALIKCVECGKEFSDRASVCPNCGCPTEIVLEELNATKKEKSKEIVAKYNIWGYEFIIDKEIDLYIWLTKAIRAGKDSFLEMAENLYYEWKDIDGVIENMPEYYSDMLAEMVSTAISTLTKVGIYDCDTNRFMKKYGDSLDVSLLLEPIISRYLEIQDFENAAKEYREYVRQQRLHTWQGGGFGIDGALKGYFKAQMLNVGTEFLHMHSDNKSHMQNMTEVARAKAELYKNKNTKKTVLAAFGKIYDICYDAIMNEITLAGVMPSNPFDESKVIPIYNNVVNILNSGDFSNNEVLRKQCLKAFRFDPSSYPLIELMLFLETENDNDELRNYAERYGFLETFYRNEQIRLREKFSKELLEIETACDSTIASNSVLFDICGKCWELNDEGIDIDRYVKQAIDERMKFSISEKELNEIRAQMEMYLEYEAFSQEFIDEILDVLETVEVDNTDREEINKIIKKVCEQYSTLKWYSSTAIYESEFIFSCKKNIKTIQNYHKFEDFAEIPKDAEVFMLWGWCGLYDEAPKRAVAVTDSGLYVYIDESWHNFSKAWRPFAEQRFGLTSYEIESVDDSIDTKNEELYKLLRDIRQALRVYFEMDTAANEENNDNAPQEVLEQVKEVCDEFAARNLSPLHYYNRKKEIKVLPAYYEVFKDFELPENIDVYYMYYVNSAERSTQYHAIMSNLGFHYYGNWKKGFISWMDFASLEISKVDKNLLKLSENDFYSLEDAKFFQKFLESIKTAIQKVLYCIPGRYYDTEEPHFNYKKFLDRHEELIVKECNEDDLIQLCLEADVRFKEIFNEINAVTQNGIRKPECFIADKNAAAYFLVTESYLIAVGVGTKICVPLNTVITLKIANDEKKELCLSIYSYKEQENTIYEYPIHISENIENLDLQPFIDELDKMQPYEHAKYYRNGAVVKQDIDKAIELYQIVAKSPNDKNKGGANYYLGLLYAQRGDLKNAILYYMEAIRIDAVFKIAASYEVAIMQYRATESIIQNTCHYSVVYYMDMAAQNKYKDAREQLMLILGNQEWMTKANEEAQIINKGSELQDIIKREGRTPVEHATYKVKSKFSKLFKI